MQDCNPQTPVALSGNSVEFSQLLDNAQPVATLTANATQGVIEGLMTARQPVILKGLVADWPAVKAGCVSDDNLDSYLRQFYQGQPVRSYRGPAAIRGHYFYNDDLNSLNFKQIQSRFDSVLDDIRQHADEPQPPAFYMGSTTLDHCLPGFRADNDLTLSPLAPLVSLWVGNQSRIPAHYDVPDNIACAVAGRRRFILFPPEQLANLYVGPLDLTPAGQPVSLVDFHQPDLERYPRFAEALQAAQIAELAPGDALFIPSMWWHHVESLDSLNVLVNYWWRQSPAFMGNPAEALHHALLNLRELPVEQRQAWQRLFEHYVFQPSDATTSHIPEHARGMLAPLDERAARRLRATLLNQLNR